MNRKFRQLMVVAVVAGFLSQPAWCVDDSRISQVIQYVTAANGNYVVGDHYDPGENIKTKTTMVLDNETGANKYYKHKIFYIDDNNIEVHSKTNVIWTVPANTQWTKNWSEPYFVPAQGASTSYCAALELHHKVGGNYELIEQTCRTFDLNLSGF